MGKMKDKLIEDMMLHPDIYIEREDYDFWIQCRKEELLEREGMDSNSQTKRRKRWNLRNINKET